MGPSHISKSLGAKMARPGGLSCAGGVGPKATTQAPAAIAEIPSGVLAEIENQRGGLVAVITLLHCVHVALEREEEGANTQPNPRIEAAVRWASLPEMTVTLLERTHAVLSALDSMNLTSPLKASEP